MSVNEESDAVKKMRNALNRHVKIDLTDGRVVFGRFRCSDDNANVVLADASEVRELIDSKDDKPRRGNYTLFVYLCPQSMG